MTYLSTLIWLVLNYSNPKMLKKETPKYTDAIITFEKTNVFHTQLIVSSRLKQKIDKYVSQYVNFVFFCEKLVSCCLNNRKAQKTVNPPRCK